MATAIPLDRTPAGPQARHVHPAEPPEELPEPALAKALREQLRGMLDKPLTVERLRSLGRLVGASVRLMQNLESGVQALLPRPKPPTPYGMTIASGTQAEDEEFTGGPPASSSSLGGYMPLVGSSYGENLGNTFVREMVGAISKSQQPRRTPADLVKAIAEARAAGLKDVVAELKAELLAKPEKTKAEELAAKLPEIKG